MNTKLIFLLILAAVLRLYALEQFPGHLTNDEAALGYNAYSILKTGRDEHGQFLPVIFKSFGDWKPGLYVYLTVPFVALVGLTELAVRLPSALLGVLAVFFVYLLGSRLFSKNVALFSALALAISPWHIHFSRGAWEVNLALVLLFAAVIFFLESFKNQKLIIVSAIFFSLTLWSYQSAKLASALVLLLLLVLYRDKLKTLKIRNLVVSGVLGLLLALPIIISVFTGESGRIGVMSVFSYTRPAEHIQETIFDQEEITEDSIIYKLFHSEELNLVRGIFNRYFNYFSGRFLFFEGDWSAPRHTSPGLGYVLFADTPFLLLGLYLLLRKEKSRTEWFIIFWLLLTPIPAALTRESVHGVRALNLVVPISLTIGIGLNAVVSYFKNKDLYTRFIVASLILVGYSYSLLLLIDAYFLQKSYENTYLYGYKETVAEVLAVRGDYDKIIFEQGYDQPYIFFLFYGANKGDTIFEPEVYQNNLHYQNETIGDVGLVTKLDNIEFRPINWAMDKVLERTLLVGKAASFPLEEVGKPEDYTIKSINHPNGESAFLLVERK